MKTSYIVIAILCMFCILGLAQYAMVGIVICAIILVCKAFIWASREDEDAKGQSKAQVDKEVEETKDS